MTLLKGITVLQVGTDTELFLRKISDGTPVSAIGLIGGNKIEPKEVLGGNGFAVQEDNVMVEFNIPASSTQAEFTGNINKMLAYLESSLAKQGLRYDVAASMTFDERALDHPKAKEVGCEPDFCVYTQSKNPNPAEAMGLLRSCGGHVHVSYLINGEELTDIYQREPMVKALDIFLGLPSVVLDKDLMRKKVYGRAGAFRPKTYGPHGGVEYRVLSNFWMKSDALKNFVFDQVHAAVNYLNTQGSNIERVSRNLDDYAGYVHEAINNGNSRYACDLMQTFGFYDKVVELSSKYPKTRATKVYRTSLS